jgi:ubiquinone/menaquinone biosynthesis C-methylase UbiE
MRLERVFRKLFTRPIKKFFNKVKNRFLDKNNTELLFWQRVYANEKENFSNVHYKNIMLKMAEESNDNFLKGKIVADFGCGPRGSLVWANSANLRIGIDVLADRYAEEFTESIISHQMIYLKSTENVIPMPSNFVDIMFTLNAIDHVDDFSDMCDEIVRVLKPGGLLIGSFNLEEPTSPCEPQQLNEQKIKVNLLNKLEVMSYRVTQKGPKGRAFLPFFRNTLSYEPGQEGFLWVKAMKSII